ncbi:DEAD/DEAH box helicase [Staphylococcus aureus]|uniref:DEAD/DEAH box helicase n=1 Tax=Staphylococcus aureus TaxID=1280 RepID=UPI00101BD13A|nr:type ISP restriction/modification enzyme [Staphylococcus aureus]HDA8161128.1 DEAD/DEAH box helicase [Staphylococcus aureus]
MEKQENYNASSFDNLIRQINETAQDVQRERGTLFERLVLAYLKNEPTYKNLYKNVWLLKDVPSEFSISKKDLGVDLVAEQQNGDLVAIQAKFNKGKIGKSEINSFVAELGSTYYTRGLIISTVDEWNSNARATIDKNEKGIEIIGLSDLRNSQINWADFSFERPEQTSIKQPKSLRPYQLDALESAVSYFKTKDRGQLIMAPGTGKTFTSLKISEALSKQSDKQFKVLYLVPSIQLLTQTLRGWNNDTEYTMTSMAVTSDRDASRGDDGTEDIKATDIGYPATTSKDQLLKNWNDVQEKESNTDLFVVFSTYQSIEVIGKAQKEGFPEFDLIISDEAHRTTGAQEMNKDASVFTKVHDNENVKGKLRMYQTATPKIYGEKAQKSAKEKSYLLSSMDDESKYGEVIYRMGFGQAVSRGILTDYKVMVLAVDETAIQRDMQRTLADPENGLNIDDVGRIVGIWNGMMRRNGYKNPIKNSPYDGAPLERAIAFTRTIEDSKKVSHQFEEVVNEYIGADIEEQSKKLSMRHADGKMNALQKGEVLDWLADPNKPSDEARIVSNVRFLTEGIDVPTLDAVIFLAPKKSQVDIVQAVGRIMRKSENKDYGYIILPIVIPAGEKPETILDNNKNYEAVWQIINALRSVDERFEAMVDKINIAKPKQLKVIGVGSAPDKENEIENNRSESIKPKISDFEPTQLEFQWDKYEKAIFGKIVEKVGDRKYLENWSADVAKIAQRQKNWIKTKLEDKNDPITIEFKKFVSSLQYNINESIDESQAVEMLSQHLITKPIFEALFSEYSFVNNNPVSSAMENIVRELEKAGFTKEQENLAPLYESVKMRAEGVEKAEDKQKIIITLYDKFFKTSFKSQTDRLGIVFTPIEVVDFIVKSVDTILDKHFGKTLASEGVHILDPFTGTGTFIVRTLEYLKEQMEAGEISLDDITRKFTQELHANEIVLLSYYIAAINIEATFDEINGESQGYIPFEGIILTDTFSSDTVEGYHDKDYFNVNKLRLEKQNQQPINVILGNPPYSAKQKNEDGNIKRVKYKNLDESIKDSYIKMSTATNKNNLFDSYIRAIKWSSLKLNDNGIIGFITNNSFIDGMAMDGMRKELLKEFNEIYIYNLLGSIRGKSKEQVSLEGGNIFDIMTGVTIVFLVKNKKMLNTHKIYYLDIGEKLTKAEKLSTLNELQSIENIYNSFVEIIPNEKGDWINQRNSDFDKLIKIGDKKHDDSLFIDYSGGITTGRDDWSWGFSKAIVEKTMKSLIDYYNKNLGDTSVYNSNVSEISWTNSLKVKFEKYEKLTFDSERIFKGMYRPFTKKYLYYTKELVDRQYQMSKLLPHNRSENLMISLSNKTSGKEFSALMINVIPDRNLFAGGSQNFPLYIYDGDKRNYSIRKEVKDKLNNIEDEDIIFYLYGLFYSKDYAKKYSLDLSKDLPRILNLDNKHEFIRIGKKLADLHVNYENVEPYSDIKVIYINDKVSFKVKKMQFGKKGKKKDYSTIIYNEDIVIRNIPLEAYNFVVNGKSAIEWIMNQYSIDEQRKSGTIDDPNEYCVNEKYIFDLLLSIINVSITTEKYRRELPQID